MSCKEGTKNPCGGLKTKKKKKKKKMLSYINYSEKYQPTTSTPTSMGH